MLNLVFFVIAVALVFDFLNGFHDAANSVATVVTTRVLSPLAAVGWAAFFNFAAAFIFGTGVAQTISGHLIDPKVIDVYVVFGGLLGAITWDIFTWWWRCPPVPRMPSSAGSRVRLSPKRDSKPCCSRDGFPLSPS
jgi:PiT family inorganic phosphate transporter